MQENKLLLFLFFILLGAGLRIASFSWNQYIHGDVGQYGVAAESLVTRGDLLIDTHTQDPYFYSLKEKGGKFLAHNPLWSLLGSVVIAISGVSGFTALKMLSFLSGIVLLLLLYRYTKRIGGEATALFSLALGSISYLLIDFSGNGSLYILQAVLYMEFLLMCTRLNRPNNAWAIGILLGLGLLLNQQAIILWPTYIIFLFMQKDFRSSEIWRRIAIGIVCSAFFFVPWMARNYLFFGTPIIPVDFAYVWGKLGVFPVVQEGIIAYSVNFQTLVALAEQSLFFWLPHNLYFINRKLFILAPLAYVFFLLLAIEMIFWWKKNRYDERIILLLPAFLIVLFHILLSSLWPIAKFRYLVPILPIIFSLGGYYVWCVVQGHMMRIGGVALSVTLLSVVSILTICGTPSHTYYYDGVLTTDNFGKQGEFEFIQTQKINSNL